MSFSVIICAYTEKRWDQLVAAVHSVRHQSAPPGEIILVIDHNPDLFRRAQAAFTTEIVIENQETRGLSGARNSGIVVASGDLLAFIDEDAVAEMQWLETLQRGFEDPDVIGVGGAILPDWVTNQPDWFPAEFNWTVGCTYLGMPQVTAPVRNLIGANMAYRRWVFEQVGGFQNGMGRIGTRPLGCEETEFCIRATQCIPHSRFLYEPLARVHHRVPAERGQFSYFLQRSYAEGLSKAQVARLVGQQQGLASERAYTFSTLPRGVIASLREAVRQRRLAPGGRAGAIISGLLTTTAGFLLGSLQKSIHRSNLPAGSQAVRNQGEMRWNR